MSELASVVSVVVATIAAAGLMRLYSQRSRTKGLSGGPNGRAALDKLMEIHSVTPKRRSSAIAYESLFVIEDLNQDASNRNAAVQLQRRSSFESSFEVTPLELELRPVDQSQTEHFVSIDLGPTDLTSPPPVDTATPWRPFPRLPPSKTTKRLLALWSRPTTPQLRRPRSASPMATSKDGLCNPARGGGSGTDSTGAPAVEVLHLSLPPDRSGCLGVVLCGAEGGSGVRAAANDQRDEAAISAGCPGSNVTSGTSASSNGRGDNVVVRSLLPGGLGWLSRALQPGDELLCVNGRSIHGNTTANAVTAITEANTECLRTHSTVKLVVRRTGR